MLTKGKIINDPVHGFISIPGGIIQDIIDHGYFQRLRRILQLGLTNMVYPGANHTRFHHALGAMHLMGVALQTLRNKGISISDAEEEAARIAILLHDVGHGPFSHALENSILEEVHHEHLSLAIMERLNFQMGGRLSLAIEMFRGAYHRPFFNQLISSQLDIDRLDYLPRDCFFTGVAEGAISADRIIRMMDVVNEELVVEEKGMFSIENFLNSRRLMYWQVYLHKTTVSAEEMLIQLMARARHLIRQGSDLEMPESLKPFFIRQFGKEAFLSDPQWLNHFVLLDDFDIWFCIKRWLNHPDFVLAFLARGIMDRKLLKVQISNQAMQPQSLEAAREIVCREWGISAFDARFLVFEKTISNSAYISGGNRINIRTRAGEILDVAQATDLPNIQAMTTEVKKYIFCQPKPISLQTFAV